MLLNVNNIETHIGNRVDHLLKNVLIITSGIIKI